MKRTPVKSSRRKLAQSSESIEKSDSGQKPPIKKVKLVVASTASSAPSFSKTMEKSSHIAIKSTRERVAKHEGVKSVSVDQFSIVLYRFINVTRDLALKPIKGFAKTFKIPFTVSNGNLVLNPLSKSARASLIDLLKERMELYDVGVSVDLVESLLDPTKWITYADYFVCLDVGEVMNPRGKLIGSLQGGKVCMTFGNSRPQRSHIVLLASGQPRPSPQHTADHLIPSEPLNDSIANLRWATKSQQNINQDAPVPSPTFKSATGTLLPYHPKWGKKFKLTSDGLIKVGKRDWSLGYEKKTGDFAVQLDGSMFNVHALVVECILGRELTAEESTDHINGDHGFNTLSNLAPVLQIDNVMKATIKLVTRIESSGKAVVFGGLYLAAEATRRSKFSGISNCLTGNLKSYKGYQWKDASEEDVASFFSKMDEVDTSKLEWPELAAGNSRYANLLKSIKLFKEWENALAKYYLSL